MSDGKRLIIIDGNSLINRAYYAIQRPMITKEGIYTQGIYGFLSMLNKILAEYDPAYIAVAWDRKAPTFRHEEYSEYKAGRKKMPVELAMELPYMKDVLQAMKIEMLEIDGFEADDIIGTVAKRGEEAGLEPFIITGDRDGLQLASEKTKVLITKRGISEFKLYDRDAMVEEYGFTPEQFIDYKGLMGDSSDNIPGLPGVGEKTASKLIHQFGSVENMIENVSEIDSPKLREKVSENAQLAVMSKRLATIVTHVPIEIDFDKMRREDPDLSKLVALYLKLEFNSLLKKIDTAGLKPGTDGAGAGSACENPDLTQGDVAAGMRMAPGEIHQYFDQDLPVIIIRGVDEIGKLAIGLDAAEASGAPVVLKVLGDGNHKSVPNIFGVNIMTNDAHYYIDVENNIKKGENLLFAALMNMFDEYEPKIIGHGLQSDIYMLFAAGSALHEIDTGNFNPKIVFDSAVAEYLINPTASNYTIKRLSLEYFGIDAQDDEDFLAGGAQMDMLADQTALYADYGLSYCRIVRSLYDALPGMIESNGLADVLQKAELPLIAPLAAMETAGFDFDKDALADVGKNINEGIDALTKDIHEISGEAFNINSPQQLGVILFEKLGLPPSKKTKTGYATGAEVLEKLLDHSPIIGKIMEYRTLTKLRGTYIDGLIPLVASDGRIHAHFRQTVTATGRISCTEPNLQNIPIRQEFGRQIRKAFVPGSDEYILIGADYSQIELRILAHFSKDPALIEDFKQGADIHRRTAARVFGVDENAVTMEQRSGAKAVNFGVIYGMSSFGLSEGLGITRREAESYISEYFAMHTAVKAYLDACVEDAIARGYSQTLLMRKRTIPELGATNHMTRRLGERLAMNTPIQGSAADIMKLAMIAVHNELRRRELRSKVILQVHDELIVRAHMDEVSEVSALMKEKMEGAYELAVPLTVDVNTGANWYELK